MKQSEWFRRPIHDFSDHPYIILDSGAYSVWRSGHDVDPSKYEAYTPLVKDETLACVNFDTIPGVWGRRATQEDVELACEKSYAQWVRLKESGALIMPVYHQGDNIKWLHRYIDEGAEFIGISPTDSFTTQVRQHWLRDIHDYMRDNELVIGRKLGTDYFTHALGVFSPRILQNPMGLWSADASTMMRYMAMKRILIPRTEPQWDLGGRIVGWDPVYVGKRPDIEITRGRSNVNWTWVREYIETSEKEETIRRGEGPRWIYEVGKNDRIYMDDYCTATSISLQLARRAMHQSGVRCFIAGALPLGMWQTAITERYPYILRSFAMIKEPHGTTIKRIYDRTWEKPARRPERDHKVEPARGLFPFLGHRGGEPV